MLNSQRTAQSNAESVRDWIRWQWEFWVDHFPYMVKYSHWEICSGWYKGKPKIGVYTNYYDGPLLAIHFWRWAIVANNYNQTDEGVIRLACEIASWLDIRDGLRSCLLTTGFVAFMVGNWVDVFGTRQQAIAAYSLSLAMFASWWAWFVIRVLANMHRDNLSTERSTDD